MDTLLLFWYCSKRPIIKFLGLPGSRFLDSTKRESIFRPRVPTLRSIRDHQHLSLAWLYLLHTALCQKMLGIPRPEVLLARWPGCLQFLFWGFKRAWFRMPRNAFEPRSISIENNLIYLIFCESDSRTTRQKELVQEPRYKKSPLPHWHRVSWSSITFALGHHNIPN